MLIVSGIYTKRATYKSRLPRCQKTKLYTIENQ